MASQTISLCMITKNEENYLEQCLDSVKDFADEIIIADTGSEDNTKEICKKFGPKTKFFDFKWVDDFSAARNESLKHATKDWILILDADELIDAENKNKIKDAIQNAEKNCVGFSIEQRSYIKEISEGARKNNSDFAPAKDFSFYIPNNMVRIFRNNLGIEFKHRIHELVEESIKEKNLQYKKTDIIIHHFGSVKDSKFMSEKVEQYSKLIIKQLQDNQKSARYNYQAARMYILKKDFKNAIGYFEKAAKLDPDYKLVFSEIAKVYLGTGNKEKAIEYFKKSMERNPKNPSPANNLAVVYMSIGKFENAKKILEDVIKKNPENEALKYNYQMVLKNMKK